MPLLDHFHPPLAPSRHWESFLAAWASTIADVLNGDLLPEGYFAEEHAKVRERIEGDRDVIPDSFGIRIRSQKDPVRSVAAIQFLAVSNKDREGHRLAFAAKCARYIGRGIGLLVIDIVTSAQARLHDQIIRHLGHTGIVPQPFDSDLFAAAYERRGNEVRVWIEGLRVGEALPTLPLPFNSDSYIPIDLEATYTTTCATRRLPV